MSTYEHRSVTDTLKEFYLRHPWIYTAVLVGLLVLILWASSVSSDNQQHAAPAAAAGQRNQILQFVVNLMNELEDNPVQVNAGEISDRLNDWIRNLNDKSAWEEDRLVEAYADNLPEQEQRQLSDLASLEFPIDDGIAIQECVLLRHICDTVEEYPTPLPFFVKEPTPELIRALRLFDWTVRNIAIEPAAGSYPRTPWEILMLGRGRAIDRAWIFTLLCRQAGIEAVMLARGNPAAPAASADSGDGEPHFIPWIPAVLSQGELYLFESEFGLPIMNNGRIATLSDVIADDAPLRAFDRPGNPYPMESSQLESSVVALVESSPHFLTRRLFILENYIRWESTADDGKIRIRQSGSAPSSAGGRALSARAVTFSARPRLTAERLRDVPHLTDVQPWLILLERNIERANVYAATLENELATERQRRIELRNAAQAEMVPLHLAMVYISIKEGDAAMNELERQFAAESQGQPLPQETEAERRRRMTLERQSSEMLRNALLQARILSMRGELVGERAAAWFYLRACPSERDLAAYDAQDEGNRQYWSDIANDTARPAVERNRAVEEIEAIKFNHAGRVLGREMATYWLGLLHFQKGSYRQAIDYLENQLPGLRESEDSIRSPAARYLLARSYEEMGASALNQQGLPAKTRKEQARNYFERARLQYLNESEPLYVAQAMVRAQWLADFIKDELNDASDSAEEN